MLRANFRLTALCAISIAFVASSCNDPDELGLDLQPVGDQPNVIKVDTFTVETYTVAEDSLVTSRVESPLFLGSMYDPGEIGYSQAGFCMQTRIGNTISATTFNGATTADSVVLSFAYNGFTGDSTSIHKISVYELSDRLYLDSVYYSSKSFTPASFLGHRDLVINRFDSVVIGGVNNPPQLRIALDTAFGGKILRQYIADPGVFASDDSWANFFKGVALVDSANDNGMGSILTLQPKSTANKLTVYFSGGSSYDFVLDEKSGRFSYFRHQYNANIGDAVQDVNIAVQSMSGLKDSLSIPYLSKLYDNGPVSISSAQLVFKLLPGSNTSGLDSHANLLVFGSDSTGKNILILDTQESSAYYGGAYNSTTQEYTFNIALHLQRTLKDVVEKGMKDYGLFLVAGGSTSNAQRTLLLGKGSVKLILTYTKVN